MHPRITIGEKSLINLETSRHVYVSKSMDSSSDALKRGNFPKPLNDEKRME